MLEQGSIEYYQDKDKKWRFRFKDKTEDIRLVCPDGYDTKEEVKELVRSVFCQVWSPEILGL